MARDSFGRNMDDWEDEKVDRPVLMILLQRSWLLLVPLIALAWYNGRVLTPQAKQLEAQIAETKAKAEEQRAKTLTDARRLDISQSALAALGDTFKVRFQGMDALIDSVTTLKKAEETDLQWLLARADSLRKVYSSTEGRWQEASVKLPPLQARIDSLTGVVAARNKLIADLEAESTTMAATADTVLNPWTYRKNTALLEGPGRFPNRDAHEKR
jgi:hypothetical protein